MPQQKEQIIEQLMTELKTNTTLHPSREEAWAAAQAEAAPLTERQQQLFERAIYAKTGHKPIHFYLPEQLIDQLSELDEQGIDPHELVTNAIESAIKVAQSVLSQKAIPTKVPLEPEVPPQRREATEP